MPQEQGEPAPVAHYPTPGLTLLGVLPENGVRGIRQCTTGAIYAVAGAGVYLIDPVAWTGTLLGSITAGVTTPVSMMDNGLDLIIVDGTSSGWDVTLSSNAFSQIVDPNNVFSGADRVDYLDTYFLFNKPGTPQFYISGSLAVTFDSLDFANKESFSDLLVTLAVAKREIWLFGERTTEIWYNAGAADFTFAQMPSTFVDHGCRAKYSIATYDNSVYWLTYDRAGQGIVMMGAGYQTVRISTFAIEAEFATYATLTDAIGFFYSLGGHIFYVLTFPTADATWVYDIAAKLWHEWRWIDINGTEHRHRANCAYPCNGRPIVGDWQNGNLYALDSAVFTDNGAPIKRLRAFPHMLADGKRVFYRQFLADIETGTAASVVDDVRTTVVNSTFTAADGTPLEDYVGPAGDVNTWTKVSGEAQILGDTLVGTSGAALYQAAAPPLFPDYVVRFAVVPPEYDSVLSGTTLLAIGRATSAAAGYQASVTADGMQYHFSLAALGTAVPTQTVAMGTLSSGRYTVWLTMRGSFISAQVQRSQEGLWLRTDGAWLADTGTIAGAFSDGTYTAPGVVMLGGTWP